MWVSENEGAKFWLSVLTDLQNRGVEHLLIACVDGLKGFLDAINATCRDAIIQLCIVHMVCNSLKFVPWKDYKAVTCDLKRIYQSMTEQEASLALDNFTDKWDEKYPKISKSWSSNWTNLITIFDYPADIRKVMYLAIEATSKKWTMPIKDWKLALNRFMIAFEE
jgi:putative transposase